MSSAETRSAALQLARKLCRSRVSGPVPRHFTDINVSFFNKLFWSICDAVITEQPLLPSMNEGPAFLQSIIDFLSTQLLNVDIVHISGEDVNRGDPVAVYRLLQIFDNVEKCLFSPAGDRSSGTVDPVLKAKSRLSVVPRHLREKLSSCTGRSVLYSPRTTARRTRGAMKRSAVISAGIIRQRASDTKRKTVRYVPSDMERLTHFVRMNTSAADYAVQTFRGGGGEEGDPSVDAEPAEVAERRCAQTALRRAKLAVENAKKHAATQRAFLRRRSEEMTRIRHGRAVALQNRAIVRGEHSRQLWHQATKEAEWEFKREVRTLITEQKQHQFAIKSAPHI